MPPAPEDAGARGRKRAIICVLSASAAFTVSAALVKSVAPSMPTMEIMLFRSFVALLVFLPLLARSGGLSALRTRQPWGHAMRTAAGFAGMFGSFYGYAQLPLATVTALGFAMPIFLSILSVPFLGERISKARAMSVGAGLLGVLIVLRPWATEASVQFVPALVVVLGVVAWAVSMVSIRRMGQAGERNITIVMWFAIGTTVFSGVLTYPVWVTPGPLALAALVGVGAVSALAQFLMTEGYRSGEATMLAPFEYGAIVYTVLLGWLLWDEVPGSWEFGGMGLLVIAGLVTWLRETVSRSPRASPPAAPEARWPPASAAPPRSPPIPARRPD